MDTQNAAQLLKISVRTLANWRKKKIGPPATNKGPHTRLEYPDVLGWVRSYIIGDALPCPPGRLEKALTPRDVSRLTGLTVGTLCGYRGQRMWYRYMKLEGAVRYYASDFGAEILDVPPLLTVADVEEILQISAAGLMQWRKLGKGPRYAELPSGTIRYFERDLASWQAASTVEVMR
jgi:hypothetical protein